MLSATLDMLCPCYKLWIFRFKASIRTYFNLHETFSFLIWYFSDDTCKFETSKARWNFPFRIYPAYKTLFERAISLFIQIIFEQPTNAKFKYFF